MPPNTHESQTIPQVDAGIQTDMGGDHQTIDAINKPSDIPLDTVHPVRFGTFGTYFIGGISLFIYAYALYALFTDYSTNYFRKVTDPNSVPNHLRAWSPLYAIAILSEGFFAYFKGHPVYKTGDTLCSLLTFGIRGVVQRLLSMVRENKFMVHN